MQDGDIFEHNGRRFRINIEDDDGHEPPWEEECGHGPVSDWTRESKRPWQWELNSAGGEKRYYDAREAMRIALNDGWGLDEEHTQALIERLAKPRTAVRPKKGEKPKMKQTGFIRQDFYYTNDQLEKVTIPGRDPAKPLTRGEIAVEAVRLDFERLRGWCDDDWRYIGVIVTPIPWGKDPKDVEIDYSYALWRIESDAEDYHGEVARELADQANDTADRILAENIEARDLMRAKIKHLVSELRLKPRLGAETCSAVKSALENYRARARMAAGTARAYARHE